MHVEVSDELRAMIERLRYANETPEEFVRLAIVLEVQHRDMRIAQSVEEVKRCAGEIAKSYLFRYDKEEQ